MVDVVAHAVPPRDQEADVVERESGKTILLDVRPSEHGGFDLGLLSGIEPPRATRARPVVKAGEPFGIEALDGIAQRLVRHAGQPRRLWPLVAIQLVGNREHAHRRPPIVLRARCRPKLLSAQFRQDLDRPAHVVPRINLSLNPVERIWLYLKERYLSHRLHDDYEAIVDAACEAWNRLTAETGRITSLSSYPWLKKLIAATVKT
jgi:hypothetical protein